MKILFTIATACLLLSACGDSATTDDVGKSEPVINDNSDPKLAQGKRLFEMNCVSCHNMDKELTGPALRGSLGRWGNDTIKLKTFISNSELVIKSGDPYANALFEKYNKSIMTPFPHLTETQLDAIVYYIGQ